MEDFSKCKAGFIAALPFTWSHPSPPQMEDFSEDVYYVHIKY